MAERPILFSGPMVLKTLDGSKTQTRRVVLVNKRPITDIQEEFRFMDGGFHYFSRGSMSGPYPCPYGQPGDQLWVRETWFETGTGDVFYRADGKELNKAWSWRPSIYMPSWASRITLEITNIRVERVQEITPADCEAEGSYWPTDKDAENGFVNLWDSINAKRGYGWDVNPWVWVIEFKRV